MSRRFDLLDEQFVIHRAPIFHRGLFDAFPFDSVDLEPARGWLPNPFAVRSGALAETLLKQAAGSTTAIPKTSAGDTIPGNASTTFTLAIGGQETGFVNTPGDDDWFRVELVAGQSYVFTMSGDGATPLEDPYLELYNAAGQLIAIDDDAGPGLNPMLRFTATQSGTYYLNARAWEPDSGPTLTGGYRVTAALGPPQDPLDSIDFGFSTPLHIDVYFATAGQTFGDATAQRSWTAAEIAAAMAALSTYSAVTNLTFSQSATSTGAEFILLIADLEDNVLGQFTVSGGSIGYGEFAPDGSGWTTAGLAPGGLGFVTLIHEFGHGLGLAHPHDNSGNSEIMQGVTGPFNSFGTFLMNQGVFTTMTYNDGWASVFPNTVIAYGSQATPMALDIALMQQRYGANQNTNVGDTVYTMPVVNAGGTLFQCIWDAGGVDTISAGATTLAATINLNAATLLNEIGGGGWVSSHSTIRGGFTIANGVVIENAIGGGGDDTITGNAAANRLEGMAGADVIRGGDGNDTLIGGAGADRLFGDAGNDVIFWDAADVLADVQGGAGNDILVFTSGAAPTTFGLGAHGFETAEGRFTDTAGQAWATQTDFYDALWRLTLTTVVNDNGSYSNLDYDELNLFTWATSFAAFDTLGRLDVDVTTYDDGTSAVLDYDQASAFAWATTWASYTAASLLDIDVITNDDSSHIVRDLDQADAFIWSTTWASYDVAGLLDIDIFTYDDGSQAVRDLDQNDLFDWATTWAQYDTLGRLDVDVVTYDDGSYAVRDLDQANQFSWASKWWLYDSGGNLIAFQGVNDDGSTF